MGRTDWGWIPAEVTCTRILSKARVTIFLPPADYLTVPPTVGSVCFISAAASVCIMSKRIRQ